ncbi:hypothetical protein M8998_02285 [Sphingobacterium sp. lm-10]|uniref:hypothetical protein n=1 Tax=Sphingobacterium sp. lm-10 TaxID=2944904 RepID=UPI002021D1A9|nr:hypothetical protein [Sphingobacterium sp. lm-10]MCL7986761.1 hypothetical protein [Sphingobacterium sp. lm-10]
MNAIQPTCLRISILFLLTGTLFNSCRKESDWNPEENPTEESVLATAKAWYRSVAAHADTTGNLDVRQLRPDWDRYMLDTNSAGRPWLSVPLKGNPDSTAYLTELSLVIDHAGEVQGIIKEYGGNPYAGNTSLTIYTVDGKAFLRGMYRPGRKAMLLPGDPADPFAINLRMQRVTRVSGGGGLRACVDCTGDMIEIEEVTVPPPGGGHWSPGQDPPQPSVHEDRPSGGGGSGGGNNNGDGNIPVPPQPKSPIDIEEVEITRQIKDKPFALFIDIPCHIIRNWLATAKHPVLQAQLTKLNSIARQTTSRGGITTKTVAQLQDINNAYSTVVNMDYFPVTINQLPVVNGLRLTAPQFIDHIRRNLNSFVNTSYAHFSPYNWYGTDDRGLWNSGNPLGAVVGIDIAGPDNGSVIVSNYGSHGWTFSTIYDPKYGQHPVSGHRDFGYTQNANGSYTFYTRGVDRLTSWDGEFARKYAKEFPFRQADALWKSFQDKINEFVRSHGGSASSDSPQIHRPDWQQVKDVLEGRAPLSTLSNDC